MIDVDSFTADQKSFLSGLVSDFDGPTMTPSVLMILERALYALKPDWELDTFHGEPELKADIEACLAGLSYYKIKHLNDQ